jgi:hypothetical protein
MMIAQGLLRPPINKDKDVVDGKEMLKYTRWTQITGSSNGKHAQSSDNISSDGDDRDVFDDKIFASNNDSIFMDPSARAELVEQIEKTGTVDTSDDSKTPEFLRPTDFHGVDPEKLSFKSVLDLMALAKASQKDFMQRVSGIFELMRCLPGCDKKQNLRTKLTNAALNWNGEYTPVQQQLAFDVLESLS